jgi:hypothetical protein
MRSSPFNNQENVKAFRRSISKSVNDILFSYKLNSETLATTNVVCDGYTLLSLEIVLDDESLPTIRRIVSAPEPDGAYYDAAGFEMCGNRADGTEEGGACVWTLADVDILPEGQRDGFSNTEFSAGVVFPVKRSVVDATADESTNLFGRGQRKHALHCHLTPSSSGLLRVHHFQHDLERRYPGKLHKRCFCDWRGLQGLVTRCDCTKDGTQSNNCGAVETAILATSDVQCNNCG